MVGPEIDQDLVRDLTDRIWSVVPQDVRRSKRITWISVYNIVRKAVSSVGCVDMEAFNDHFDIKAIDPHDRDTIYRSLVNELSKYACEHESEYDPDSARAMTLNYIQEAVDSCLRSKCTESDINELIGLVNDNKEILGPKYSELLAMVQKLKAQVTAEPEVKPTEKPETKPIEKPEIKPVVVTPVVEDWNTILRPIRVRVVRGSGSRVSDPGQENWALLLRPSEYVVRRVNRHVVRRVENRGHGFRTKLLGFVEKLYEFVVA